MPCSAGLPQRQKFQPPTLTTSVVGLINAPAAAGGIGPLTGADLPAVGTVQFMDGNTALGNYTTSIQGTYAGHGPAQTSCGEAAALTPCINAAAFVDASAATFNNFTGFSTQNRNQFRGPHFFDVDMALYKNFRIKEKVNFAVGLQAFNAFNHPNFANPYGGPNGYANNDPSGGVGMGCGCVTPDVAGQNPVLGSGGNRATQLGLKFTF